MPVTPNDLMKRQKELRRINLADLIAQTDEALTSEFTSLNDTITLTFGKGKFYKDVWADYIATYEQAGWNVQIAADTDEDGPYIAIKFKPKARK